MYDYSRNNYELSILHNAVVQYFEHFNYTYQHHVPMPIRGIADFIAISKTGSIYVVECKKDCNDLEGTIIQVLNYQVQYDALAKAAIALPSHAPRPNNLALLKKHHITLMRIPMLSFKFRCSLDYDDDLIKTLMSLPESDREQMIKYALREQLKMKAEREA